MIKKKTIKSMGILKSGFILLVLFFINKNTYCGDFKKILKDNEIPENIVLIVGLIEFDYAGLEHKSINGVDVIISSVNKVSNFKLPNSLLPEQVNKKYKFINCYGNEGEYSLDSKKILSVSETNQLLNLMGYDYLEEATTPKSIQKYKFAEGKIMNLGKIIVTYEGGSVDYGNINYSYGFVIDNKDSVALQVFKVTYPELYNKYKNRIYTFKSPFQLALEYLLDNISAEKSDILLDFIEQYPNNFREKFGGFNKESCGKYVNQINNYTLEELRKFIYE